jgi:hypothetical protein
VFLPVWLYVSVTGVVLFFMLRGSAPESSAAASQADSAPAQIPEK